MDTKLIKHQSICGMTDEAIEYVESVIDLYDWIERYQRAPSASNKARMRAAADRVRCSERDLRLEKRFQGSNGAVEARNAAKTLSSLGTAKVPKSLGPLVTIPCNITVDDNALVVLDGDVMHVEAWITIMEESDGA